MDREYLTEWSLELADDEFPTALAALGVLAALGPSRLGQAYATSAGWQLDRLADLILEAIDADTGVLLWQVPDTLPPRGFEPQLRAKTAGSPRVTVVPVPTAVALARVWRDVIARLLPPADPRTRGLRLAVRAMPQDSTLSIGMAQTLAHATVGASGVFVLAPFRPEGRPEWRWPFTVATLPRDPLADSIADLQRGLPHNWPFRYTTASRETSRFEILVIGAGASDALARLLASKLALRCCLVIVAGLGADSPRTAEPLLRALVARLSAEGVAVLDSGSSPRDFAGRVNSFAYELAHNWTVDVALMQAFGPGTLLLVDPRLLKRAHLAEAITQTTKRLRRLEPGTELQLSDRSFQRLGIPAGAVRSVPSMRATGSAPPEPTSAARPDEVANAIEATRDRYRFQSEGDEASAVSELNRSLRREERTAQRRAAVPRYVQQRSLCKVDGRFVEERSGYVVGRPIMLQVHIGPKQEGSVAAPTAFPENKLPKQRDAHRLQVVFHEPRQFDQPLMREISLPRLGDSSTAQFVFTPRTEGAFEGRLSVLHRGRILQTVLLKTQVAAPGVLAGPGITLDDETQVHRDWSDLGTRRQFDLAMVLNHTPAGKAAATGISGKRAWATNLDGISQPVLKINDLISAVAHSTADYGDGLDKGENPQLLTKLARVGANLYSLLYRDQLKQLATEGFDVGDESVSHVQVISARPDAVVPLEFMYDFNAPDPDATICPQHRKALEDGRCPADCARAAKPRGHVCPMGFWGLKKVIERHLFDPKAATPAGAQVVVQVEAVEGRDRLELASGALVGHSEEVEATEVQDLVASLTARFGTAVPVVKDWDEWVAAVRSRQPALLVAFPHNEGKEEDVVLEIGGKKLYTLDLPVEYVRAQGGPPPLVFLLGCDVAGTAQDFSSHIRYFRQAGAAVVVSTIATVFGAHAVRVGESIVSGLVDPEAHKKARIGELIRDAKRAALLGSVPMALCVVAFGDADWRL